MVLPAYDEFQRLLSEPVDDCPICREPFNRGFRTVCGHVFCIQCAREWFREKCTCPSCREILYDKHTMPYEMRGDYDDDESEDGYTSDDEDESDDYNSDDDESDDDTSDDDTSDISTSERRMFDHLTRHISEEYQDALSSESSAHVHNDGATSPEDQYATAEEDLDDDTDEDDDESTWYEDEEPRDWPACDRYDSDSEAEDEDVRDTSSDARQRILRDENVVPYHNMDTQHRPAWDYHGQGYHGQDYHGQDYHGQDHHGQDYHGQDYHGQDSGDEFHHDRASHGQQRAVVTGDRELLIWHGLACKLLELVGNATDVQEVRETSDILQHNTIASFPRWRKPDEDDNDDAELLIWCELVCRLIELAATAADIREVKLTSGVLLKQAMAQVHSWVHSVLLPSSDDIWRRIIQANDMMTTVPN